MCGADWGGRPRRLCKGEEERPEPLVGESGAHTVAARGDAMDMSAVYVEMSTTRPCW
jgi:hypothetical protein